MLKDENFFNVWLRKHAFFYNLKIKNKKDFKSLGSNFNIITCLKMKTFSMFDFVNLYIKYTFFYF